METVSRSGLLLWDRTALKSVRSGPVPVPQSGPASLHTRSVTSYWYSKLRKCNAPRKAQRNTLGLLGYISYTFASFVGICISRWDPIRLTEIARTLLYSQLYKLTSATFSQYRATLILQTLIAAYWSLVTEHRDFTIL